ncbi:MAG: hypothetical protein LBF34_05515 [Puniceicoccales bacterium]|jgi:hypothetical protein|nr:hypothetical protein [Puniceicoccales bacterium]
MNIINDKLKSTKWISAIVIGSLFIGTLVNASSRRPRQAADSGSLVRTARDLMSEEERQISARLGKACYTKRLTSQWIRKLTAREMGLICWPDMYGEIFSIRKLRAAVTAEQIAAIPEEFVDNMNVYELSGEQLKGVTPGQLRMVGQTLGVMPGARLQFFEKVKKIENKLNPEQRRALAIAEERVRRMQDQGI